MVVEELATRMAQQGHSVTCYNRGGHHVSGSAFDAEAVSKYKGVRLKTVPTIVIAVIGCALTPFIPKLISGDVPDNLNIYLLYLLNLGATVLKMIY